MSTSMGTRSFDLWLLLLTSSIFMNLSLASYPCSKKDFGHDAVVCVCNSTFCDTVDPVVNPGSQKGWIYTSSKTGDRFNKTGFTFTSTSLYSTIFTVNRNVSYQTIQGFGGAFTDAAGINILSLPIPAQEKLLQSYYSPQGIEYTIGRIPMASCDFSTHPYSYDDYSMDFQLKNFSLTMEDLKYKIPIIQKALSMSTRTMSIFGSPWSAPAWMKTNKNMTGRGSLIGQPGGKYFKTWANYFVKFLQAYQSHNISLWGLTAQNEPIDGELPRFPFQSMGWTPEMQRDFIVQDLGPALHNNGFEDIKLMILDDQRFLLPKWSSVVLSDKSASAFISGIAVHWYADAISSASDLDKAHLNFPEKFLFASEACEGDLPWEKHVDIGSWYRAEAYGHSIVQILSDPNITKYVQGVGIHWYYDFLTPASLLDTFHANHPTMFMLATEACYGSFPWEADIELGAWKRAEAYSQSIIQDINHWVTGWTDWNIALDMQGGPNWVSNFVDSPIIVNKDKQEFYKQPMFYAMGHFSKFVIPGSKRIEIKSQGSTDLEITAFISQDTSIVLVILNRHDTVEAISIQDPEFGYLNTKVPAHTIQTLVWWH